MNKEIEKAINYLKFLKEKNNTPSIDIKLTTAITALEAQKDDMWIPVTERFPEEDFQYYIVTMKKSDNRYVVEYCLYKQCDKKFYLVADGNDELNQAWEEQAKDVIAWKNCPEPWKEEQQ